MSMIVPVRTNTVIKIILQYQKKSEETEMRIAVTYENGNIFQHFGHTEQFKIYDIENNAVVKSEVKNTMGAGHGALYRLLRVPALHRRLCRRR